MKPGMDSKTHWSFRLRKLVRDYEAVASVVRFLLWAVDKKDFIVFETTGTLPEDVKSVITFSFASNYNKKLPQ